MKSAGLVKLSRWKERIRHRTAGNERRCESYGGGDDPDDQGDRKEGGSERRGSRQAGRKTAGRSRGKGCRAERRSCQEGEERGGSCSRDRGSESGGGRGAGVAGSGRGDRQTESFRPGKGACGSGLCHIPSGLRLTG